LNMQQCWNSHNSGIEGLHFFGDAYRGRSVLVTGHTGFKGSWLAFWLSLLGANVKGFALPPHTEPSLFNLLGLRDEIRHIEGDIRDYETLMGIFMEEKPEIVFHLAAQALVRDSYNDPKNTFDTNVAGTVNVLEAVRRCPSVKAAIIVTSDKCYENREWLWGYRENDPMGGLDPYSASKGAAEIVCSSYGRSFFDGANGRPKLGFSTVRAGNVIGGGDWAKDRVIPDCVRSLSAGQPVILRNPGSVRPWQHVLDPLSGYMHLGSCLLKEPGRYSGAWNFGPVDCTYVTVGALANRFVSAWGDRAKIRIQNDSHERKESSILRLCIDKAINELGWFPVLDVSAAIDWALDWYRSWRAESGNSREVTLNQIRSYIERAKNRDAVWVGQDHRSIETCHDPLGASRATAKAKGGTC
jgi:CDP-glucose 4,6-dehydratase